MQTVVDEGQRVLKKQRLSADQIDRHLDELLTHVEETKQRLAKRQAELYRKKNNHRPSGSTPERTIDCREVTQNEVTPTSDSTGAERSRALEKSDLEPKDAETIGPQDNETELIIRDFIERVQRLNVDKNVASELKSMHVLLSKYSKHIDKVYSCSKEHAARVNTDLFWALSDVEPLYRYCQGVSHARL